MPRYLYQCSECGNEFSETRRFAESESPALCECGGVGERLFTAGFQIVGCRWTDSDANRNPLGAKDALEAAKADERSYHDNRKHWKGKPSKPRLDLIDAMYQTSEGNNPYA